MADSRAQDNRTNAPILTGGLFNPPENLYVQYWGPGGVSDRLRDFREELLADTTETEETLP